MSDCAALPYFEPYGNRRAIVERVPECSPDLSIGIIGDRWISLQCRLSLEDNDAVVAALTRNAITCWAAGVKAEAQVATQALRVCCLTDHAEVNAAAHALADALEIQP